MAFVDLSNTLLLDHSARPAQEVVIRGVSPRIGKIRVALTPQGGATMWAAIRRVDNQSIAFVVPVSLNGVDSNEDLDVQVVVRGNRSPMMRLHVEALPPTPGTTNLALSKFSELGSLLPASEELQGSSVLRFMIDHPNNPNSIKAMLEGSAPLLEGKQLDRDMAERVLASSGLLQAIDELNAYLKQNPLPDLTTISSFRVMSDPSAWNSFFQSAPGKATTAEALIYQLSAQQQVSAFQNAAPIQYVLKTAALATASLIPLSGMHPAAVVLAGITNGFVIGLDLYLRTVQGSLAGNFKDLRALASPSLFEAEHPAISGSWRALAVASTEGIAIKVTDMLSPYVTSAALLTRISEISIEQIQTAMSYFDIASPVLWQINPEVLKAEVTPYCSAKNTTPDIISIGGSGNTFSGLKHGHGHISVSLINRYFFGARASERATLSASINLHITKPQYQYILTAQSKEIFTNSFVELKLERHASDGTQSTVTPDSWKVVSNNSGSTITQDGLYTSGNSAGQDTVEAKHEGKSYSITINVVEYIEYGKNGEYEPIVFTTHIVFNWEGDVRRSQTVWFHIYPGDKFSGRRYFGSSTDSSDHRPWSMMDIKVIRADGTIDEAKYMGQPTESILHMTFITARTGRDAYPFYPTYIPPITLNEW
jgi:hypothetical protein